MKTHHAKAIMSDTASDLLGQMLRWDAYLRILPEYAFFHSAFQNVTAGCSVDNSKEKGQEQRGKH